MTLPKVCGLSAGPENVNTGEDTPEKKEDFP